MGIDDEKFQQGGLTVTTTIDPAVQKAAEDAGSAARASSPMHGLPNTYQAAVIGIDPTNGRVLGYYGGRQIIHGHTPIQYLIEGIVPKMAYVYMGGQCVDVDGGMYLGGPGFIYRLPD